MFAVCLFACFINIIYIVFFFHSINHSTYSSFAAEEIFQIYEIKNCLTYIPVNIKKAMLNKINKYLPDCLHFVR